MKRTLLLAAALLLAGCLDAPPTEEGGAPASLSDEWGIEPISVNTSEAPRGEPMTIARPTPTMSQPEPAAIGEWVNGTHLDARLSVETFGSEPRDRAVVTIELLPKNASADPLRLTFNPRSGTVWDLDLVEARTWQIELEVYQLAHEAVPYLIEVAIEEAGGGRRLVSDAAAYQWQA